MLLFGGGNVQLENLRNIQKKIIESWKLHSILIFMVFVILVMSVTHSPKYVFLSFE